jgi:hypothetical protein
MLVGIASLYSGSWVCRETPFFCETAWADGDWRKEFDDVCSKTQDAMLLEEEELRILIGRCDALKPRIDELGEQHRKVTSKRLQMCRDLFSFTLEAKENR